MENNYLYKVLFCWILVCFAIFVHIAESSDSSEITDLNSDGQIKPSNCSLTPEKNKMQLNLDKLINSNNRLIKLDITVNWNQYQPNETYPTHVSWLMTTDASGQHLLLLHPSFEVMSLGTLSYGVAAMEINFLQNPESCLGNMTANEAEKFLQFTLLTLPNTSKATNEDQISLLHICTNPLVESGECCNLALSGDNVKCYVLSLDNWISIFYWILSLLAMVMFSRCIYLIPRSVYDDANCTYTFLNRSDNVFDIKLKIVKKRVTEGESLNQQLPFECIEGLTKIEVNNDTLLDRFRNKLDMDQIVRQEEGTIYNYKIKLGSVKKKDDQLLSESIQSLKLSQSLYKTFSDIFLKCKIRNAEFFRHICYDTLFENIRWAVCLNKITKCFIIGTCLIPFSLRIAFSFKYQDEIRLFGRWGAVVIVVLVFCLLNLHLIVLKTDKGLLKEIKQAFVKCLRIVNEQSTEEKLKSFIVITLSPFRLRWCKCCRWLRIINLILLPFSLAYGTALLCITTLPMLRFPCILFSQINIVLRTYTRDNMIKYASRFFLNFLTILCGYLIFISATVLFLDSFMFYLQCFAYILFGLLLNFDNVSNTVLLILIVVTYAFDCLSRAYKTTNDFNYRVIKVLYELIGASSTNDEGTLFKKVQIENKNRMTRLSMLTQAEKQFISIVADKEGKPCFSTIGLIIYYKFQKPENLPFVHIPERFVDELALKRGQLTPGSKYMLLFEACKEIASMFCAIVFIFFVFTEFGRKNDISAGVNTVVTVGSSAILVMLNKLLFTADAYSLNDNDVHLKALVERQAKRFMDIWMKADFEIQNFGVHSINEYSVQSASHQPGEHSESIEDCDIVVEICEKEERQFTESWYIKPFYQNKSLELLPIIDNAMPGVLRRLDYDAI